MRVLFVEYGAIVLRTIEASELFSSKNYLDNLTIDEGEEISLDFSNVNNIELKDITALLNVQKVALLNKKRLKIENVCPDVLQVLEITGLYKTFSNMMSNPILISKRKSLSSWK